jgi:hypothetical protein
MFWLAAIYLCAIGYSLEGNGRSVDDFMGAWEAMLCWSALFYDFIVIRLFVKSFKRTPSEDSAR